MLFEHSLPALLQLHLHSRLNTWLQYNTYRQLEDKMGNISVLWFGASYIRDLTVIHSWVTGVTAEWINREMLKINMAIKYLISSVTDQPIVHANTARWDILPKDIIMKSLLGNCMIKAGLPELPVHLQLWHWPVSAPEGLIIFFLYKDQSEFYSSTCNSPWDKFLEHTASQVSPVCPPKICRNSTWWICKYQKSVIFFACRQESRVEPV